MRSPMDVLAGRVGGFTKKEGARPTGARFKKGIEKGGEGPPGCPLGGSGEVYRLPLAGQRGIQSPAPQAPLFRGERGACERGLGQGGRKKKRPPRVGAPLVKDRSTFPPPTFRPGGHGTTPPRREAGS